MTTIETSDQPIALPRPMSLFARVYQQLVDYRFHQARRKVLIHLSNYDAHLLRDLGIDPKDVEDAFNNRSRSLLLHPIRPNDGR